MSEELKAKVWLWFTKLTVKRLGISILALSSALFLYTFYENRQQFVEAVTKRVLPGDFSVKAPTAEQIEIVRKFLVIHPEVKFITLIDADPVTNRRVVIHRFSTDDTLVAYFAKIDKERPGIGDGPLFTDNQESNEQVLAISNGEFRCGPSKGGIVERLYPDVAKDVKISCRVPVPPAFRRAGGWFSLHLTTESEPPQLKTAGLTMSFLYFEATK